MHSKLGRGSASVWWLHRRRSKVLASSIAADLVLAVTLVLVLVLVLALSGALVERVYKCRMEHWVITRMKKSLFFLLPFFLFFLSLLTFFFLFFKKNRATRVIVEEYGGGRGTRRSEGWRGKTYSA